MSLVKIAGVAEICGAGAAVAGTLFILDVFPKSLALDPESMPASKPHVPKKLFNISPNPPKPTVPKKLLSFRFASWLLSAWHLRILAVGAGTQFANALTWTQRLQNPVIKEYIYIYIP